jgi:hypothetical protein
MKALSFLAIAALFAATLPTAAQQRPYQESAMPAAPKAVGGPLKLIYRVSGVRDDGTGAGVATSFHCTSGSAVNETLRIGVRNNAGSVAGMQTVPISPNRTITMSTHSTNIFGNDRLLAPGVVIIQGSAQILATSNKVFCSAMIVDAAAAVPQGIALHMVRFDPFPGTQE